MTITSPLVSGNSPLNGPTGGIGAISIINCTVADNFCGNAGTTVGAGGFGDESGLNTLLDGGVSITAANTPPFTPNNTIVAGSVANNNGGANFQGTAFGVFGTVTSGQGNFIPAIGSVTTPGFVIFTVDRVLVGAGVLINGVASFTLPPLPPGGHNLGAIYGGSQLFAASSGVAGENVTQTIIPNVNMPPGTMLSSPVNYFVPIFVLG